MTGRAPSAPRASRVRVRLSLLNPTTTLHHPPWRPTKRRARVSHARNASVTLAIRNLGMKRRRTSYPTPKSTHALSVSEFWVIFPEGPKRQPKARDRPQTTFPRFQHRRFGSNSSALNQWGYGWQAGRAVVVVSSLTHTHASPWTHRH